MVNLGYKAIWTEQYKYIHYTNLEGMDESYDLKEDPYELKNSINNVEHENTINGMKNKLKAYLEE